MCSLSSLNDDASNNTILEFTINSVDTDLCVQYYIICIFDINIL